MNKPIDLAGVTLRTERLTLRPWRESDLADLYAYASVDGVGQMAGWLPHQSMDESKAILQMFVDEKHTFALEYEGRVVGSLGVDEYDEAELPEFAGKQGREIGYVLAKDCWGRGLMPEALRAVVDWLFQDVGLDFLVCGHFTDNDQSRKVQEKCGFAHYKLIEQETRYGIVKNCWLSLLER